MVDTFAYLQSEILPKYLGVFMAGHGLFVRRALLYMFVESNTRQKFSVNSALFFWVRFHSAMPLFAYAADL